MVWGCGLVTRTFQRLDPDRQKTVLMRSSTRRLKQAQPRSTLNTWQCAAYQGDPALTEQGVAPMAEVLTAVMHDIFSAAQQRGELRAKLDLEATVWVLNTLMIAAGDAQILSYLNQYCQLYDETTGV